MALSRHYFSESCTAVQIDSQVFKNLRILFGCLGFGGRGSGKRGTVPGWKNVEGGLNLSEYAWRFCDEVKLPRQGNTQLIGDCIRALSTNPDWRGGFFLLMEAWEKAKAKGFRTDRWWYVDGKYLWFLKIDGVCGEYYEAPADEPKEIVIPEIFGISGKPN